MINTFPFESILALWDFLAAFPSVEHKWILRVFEFYGFPRGFLHFLNSLFFNNYAVYSSLGFQSFLYSIVSGIVQGCPSAGLCFAVAADPFFRLLESMQNLLVSKDRKRSFLAVRGCADDIGASLSSYKLLKIVKPVFDKAQHFAGLTLNPRKCILIPTRYNNFEEKPLKLKNGSTFTSLNGVNSPSRTLMLTSALPSGPKPKPVCGTNLLLSIGPECFASLP